MARPVKTALDAIGRAAMHAVARQAEVAADGILGSYAGLVAIGEATGCGQARRAALELRPFLDLLLALEIAEPGLVAVPADTLAMLQAHRGDIEATGGRILNEIDFVAPAGGAPDFAAGVKLGLARTRLLDQAIRRPRGKIRRR